jgi:hypothetical protein
VAKRSKKDVPPPEVVAEFRKDLDRYMASYKKALTAHLDKVDAAKKKRRRRRAAR